MSKVVGFKRIVTHDRAREAVNRFCNAYLNRDPHKQRPQISIPANEEDDDLVLTDYIAQRRAAEQLPMRLLERLCDGLTRMISGDRTGPSAQHMLEWVEQVRGGDNPTAATPQAKCTDPLCLGDCGLAEVADSTKVKPTI